MQNRVLTIGGLTLANPFVLAPMAGITDLPYRLIHKSFGAALVTTEMVSANGLLFSGDRTWELLASAPAERPLAVQLFGSEPARLAEAARRVEPVAELIDINCGCPVKKVLRSGAGVALMRDPALIGRIVAAVRRATGRPLTVKIRSGWDAASINFLEVARIAAEEGADGITLHPRSRAQMFSGRADWGHLTQLVQACPLPVIGSGDVFCATDGLKMLRETGCAGVMIGRGGYGNPWLLRQLLDALQGRPIVQPTLADRREVALRHLELAVAHLGDRRALLELRKHLCWYSRGLAGAGGFRSRLQHIGDLGLLRSAVEDFFGAVAAESDGVDGQGN